MKIRIQETDRLKESEENELLITNENENENIEINLLKMMFKLA